MPIHARGFKYCAACTLLLLLLLGSKNALADPKPFDIQESDAARSLLEFGRQAAIQILFASDKVKGVTTNAVRGNYEPLQAIHLLLSGTGLSVSERARGVLVVEPEVKLMRISTGSANGGEEFTGVPVAASQDASNAIPVNNATSPANEGSRGPKSVTNLGGASTDPHAEDNGTLGEIVVTARKRNERLLDIPESITFIAADTLIAKGVNTIEDVGRLTPNLQLNMRQDLTTDVVIRGVGAYGDVLGVGFTIDDVPNFTDQSMRIVDLNSIEVLKGPQGTLYGGSSIGGEIIYHSKLPRFDWSGEASIDTGSYRSTNLSLAQNVPLLGDRLAMRVSIYDVQSHGFVTNSALGLDGTPSRDSGLRTAVLFKLDPTFNALLTLRYSNIINASNEYAPVTAVNQFTYDVPYYEKNFNRRSTYGGVLKLDKIIDGINVTSLSSYTRALYAQRIDITFTPPGIPGQSFLTLPGNRPTTVATQELRVTSPEGRNIDWIVGAYGAVIKDVLLNQTATDNYPPPANVTLVNDFETKRVDTAMFSTVNAHFGRMTLGGGIRLTQTRFRANVYVEPGGLPNQTATETSKAVLPKITFSYRLPGEAILYADVAKGEEPGAVNTVSVAPISFKSETALSYEMGTKGTLLDKRFSYEFAAFYIDSRNHQYATQQYIASQGGVVTLVANIGNSTSRGVEASAQWQATPSLALSASSGYLNARWGTASVFGSNIDGRIVPNSPKLTAAFGIDYVHSVFDKWQINTNIDAAYTSKFWWDLVNTPGSEEPAYWMVNTKLGVAPQDKNWELGLRVTNVLGARYWTEYYPNFFGGGPPYAGCAGCDNVGSIAAPREFWGYFRIKY